MTVLITRRTQRRTHLFRPDPQMNELFMYLLAVIADRHGVLVHGVTLMSTHEHLVVTDIRGCLPRFLAELHRTVAMCVKVLRKWEGPVWDSEKTSVVELRTAQAVIEKLAYVAANPVAAGLVSKATDWPGVITTPDDFGRAKWTVSRPTSYLDKENPLWPSTVTLTLSLPPSLGLTAEQGRSAVAKELAEQQETARDEVRAKGWAVLGAERLLRLSPFQRAKSFEPLRGLNPTFAVGRKQATALLAAVKVLRAFRSAYRTALEAWRTNARNVVFPPETWLMRTLHGVAVAPG